MKAEVASLYSKRGNYGMFALYLVCATIFLFLIFPIFIVIPMSFSSSRYLTFPPPGLSLQWYERFFSDQTWLSSAFLSVKVALLTAATSTLLGSTAALGLSRAKFRGKELLYVFIFSPMIVPVIIIAIAIYFLYARLNIIGTTLGLVLAHTVLATPFVVVTVSAMLKGYDETLDQAAMNLGANRFNTFRYVTLPLIKPGVITGALFAFITSFDEIVITIFISGTRAITLPKKMWESIRFDIEPTIAAVSSLLIGLSTLILLLVGLMRRVKYE